jgi:hypothetical protein
MRSASDARRKVFERFRRAGGGVCPVAMDLSEEDRRRCSAGIDRRLSVQRSLSLELNRGAIAPVLPLFLSRDRLKTRFLDRNAVAHPVSEPRETHALAASYRTTRAELSGVTAWLWSRRSGVRVPSLTPRRNRRRCDHARGPVLRPLRPVAAATPSRVSGRRRRTGCPALRPTVRRVAPCPRWSG